MILAEVTAHGSVQRSKKGAESGRWGGEDTQRGGKDGETHLATPFSL